MASRDQMTRKGAANFLYWKFYRDLLQDGISLRNIVVTHFDYDHYGGLLDLLSQKLYDGTIFRLTVDNLYHGGIGRFKQKPSLGSAVKASLLPLRNASKASGVINVLSKAPTAFARNPHELCRVMECFTHLTIAEIILQASLARKASSALLDFKRCCLDQNQSHAKLPRRAIHKHSRNSDLGTKIKRKTLYIQLPYYEIVQQ
jgi:hypothetical protein